LVSLDCGMSAGCSSKPARCPRLLHTRWELSLRLSRYKSVMNKGSLGAAIIASLAVGLALGFAAGQASPSIQVVPTPAGRGQVVAVYGRDFCGSPGCSTVTIVLDDTVLTTGVQVSADGAFSFPFVASQVPDQYRVTARQTTPDGSSLEASYGLLIVGADLPPGQTPTIETLPPTATAPVLTAVTPGPSASPTVTPMATAGASATPAPTVGASATPSSTTRGHDGATSALPWVLAALLATAVVVLLLLAGLRLTRRKSH